MCQTPKYLWNYTCNSGWVFNGIALFYSFSMFLRRFRDYHSKPIEQRDENVERFGEKEGKALLTVVREHKRWELDKQD